MLTAESALRKDRTTSGDLQHRHFATIARIIANTPPGMPRAQIAYHFGGVEE